MTFGTDSAWRRLTAVICAVLIAPGGLPLIAQDQPPAAQPPAAGADAPKLKSPDQLESLVAPIALYPDPLLAQVLAASTYPLEVVQAQRWLKANPKLTGEKLTKEAAKQPWEASVQALVAFPQALKLLDDNIQWTTDLGNAFLDQQGEVMDAIQRMRKKATDSGKLKTTKEQKVEVQTVESKTIVQIQPSNPQVIYVPSYDPVVVYGAPPAYAYPPLYYPSAGAVAATAAVSFGVGVMMGAFWSGCCGHGGWGWGCGWGNNNITINNNFNTRYGYNNVNNIQGGNRTNIQGGNRTNVGSGNSNWGHQASHRGAVPYSNRNTAQRFGGASRDAAGNTQRFDRSGQRRDSGGDRGDRGNQRGDRGDQGRDIGGGNRDRGQSGSRGGGDRMGNRSIGSDSGRGRDSAFSGSESRSRADAASNRGFSSSRGSSGGGGGSSRSSGGGGGGGGARRSGGGRRR